MTRGPHASGKQRHAALGLAPPCLKLWAFQRLPSMSAASPGNASALFDLKSASLTLVAFVLKTGNIQTLGQAMAERFGDTPDFFSRDPIVIDVTHLASLDAAINFDALIALLTSFKLNPVAVRGGTVKQMAAALEAGLGEAAPRATRRPASSRPAWSPSCCPSLAPIAPPTHPCPPMCAASPPRSVWMASALFSTPSRFDAP